LSENSRVPQHLAWHETLELHEVVATLAHQMIAFKMQLANIQDLTLRGLYTETIRGFEQDMRDLLPYFRNWLRSFQHFAGWSSNQKNILRSHCCILRQWRDVSE
jgi:hypothetical protein